MNMFYGTTYIHDSEKMILVETYHSSRFDKQWLSNDCFALIILEHGSLLLKIDDTDCFVASPAVICLDDRKNVSILNDSSFDVRIIKFLPQFLNVNMTLDNIRSNRYEQLCQKHDLFKLSPFLSKEPSENCINLSQGILQSIISLFNNLSCVIEEQDDWYWSCRARAYFMDIINILERVFYNFYIDEVLDSCIQIEISGEFKQLLEHINTHLYERITLTYLYQKFRINKNQIEKMFREILGVTFYEYLRTRRYEQATYYLRFTELEGEQIADRIGLSSSQNFCKFFKSISGMTPNQYRKTTVIKRKNDPELLSLIK